MKNNGGIKGVIEKIEQEELKGLLENGGNLLSKGKIKEAKKTYKEALEIARIENIVDGELICLCYIGDIFYHQARAGETDCFSPAIDYFEEAGAVLKSEYRLRDLRYDLDWKFKAFRKLAVKVFYYQLRSYFFCGNPDSAVETLKDLALVSFSFQKTEKLVVQIQKTGGSRFTNLMQELPGRDSQWTFGSMETEASEEETAKL